MQRSEESVRALAGHTSVIVWIYLGLIDAR